MRKLNNKGFTLIELLAVIVILALIMVIAIPNVLNSMNNSRVSAIHSKAKSIVETYSTAYAADQLLSGGSNNENAQLYGVGTIPSTWTCINDVSGFAKWAELSENDYVLSSTTKPSAEGIIASVSSGNCSAIMLTSSNKLEVILVATTTGKFHYGGKSVTYAYSEDSEGHAK